MHRSWLVLLALALSTLLNGCVTLAPTDQDARAAALAWLALLDAGKFEQAYADRPPRILAGSNKEDYLRFMQGRRAPFGKALRREFVRVTYTKKLVGAPDGNYGIIVFKSSFEHKEKAQEGVTVTGETGRWQVSGYRFY